MFQSDRRLLWIFSGASSFPKTDLVILGSCAGILGVSWSIG